MKTYIHIYKTEWADCDNYVLTLYEASITVPAGILILQVFK